ncbi:MAG: bifunctional folylpolyglutamate synthase/dihydrofolate synthase [Phycisphaerae bacterium]|nr:bifunctional folylpolyglutamate synthase/dihydrofolate synthase [Gemmatimonadaceae bacterium]
MPDTNASLTPELSSSEAMPRRDYRQALEALFARTTGEWKLGLERVSGFLERLGNPHHAYPVFHVAGTNGKGSTIATLDAILRGSGLRIARYTSPHLVDFRERIVVNGEPIASESVVEFLQKWDPEAAKLGSTFFEVTTAMALHHFALQRVDVALVEVGLGGRLDATNVVQPLAAAVTQIGFDHVEFLGKTLPEIAGEKAGIFKAGSVAVVGEVKPESQAVLVAQAERVGCSEILINGRDFRVSDVSVTGAGTSFTHEFDTTNERFRTSLTGSFQADNSAVALAMLRGAGGRWAGTARDAAEFLGQVHIAGRFHRVGRFIFDVAHNVDGATAVAANIRDLGVTRPLVAVVSVLKDKDWRGIIHALSGVVDEFVLTDAPTAPESRAWSIDDVYAWAKASGVNVRMERNFDAVLATVAQGESTVLITGSFHTVGDAMERLQVNPLAR